MDANRDICDSVVDICSPVLPPTQSLVFNSEVEYNDLIDHRLTGIPAFQFISSFFRCLDIMYNRNCMDTKSVDDYWHDLFWEEFACVVVQYRFWYYFGPYCSPHSNNP